ncbi:hypothetical protein QAD16_05925 [Stenotrophomonas geniculata]|nr:hypothetical protein [Stenotrophomonas geniculata]MDH7548870.1 hypothetical protein [Stenotrophomonas geniculata]
MAKGEFQFRDLRAKAGTDKADSATDIREAQAQLGHSSVTTTEIYVRKKRGSKATPTRQESVRCTLNKALREHYGDFACKSSEIGRINQSRDQQHDDAQFPNYQTRVFSNQHATDRGRAVAYSCEDFPRRRRAGNRIRREMRSAWLF